MASKLPPVKGAAYTYSTSLFAQADNEIKTTPTLAAGDVKVIKDGGASANITSLPSETPASSGVVSVALSATEMDADEVVVVFKDASGAEWWSQTHVIHTAAQTYDTTDGVADAIKAKTDNLPASPAAVGSAMTLADAAITAAKIDTGAVDADALAADAAVEIAAAVWDRVLTGATHNIASSAGRRLRSIPDTIGGSVDDATPSATEFATSLAGAYSDDHFNDQTIRFTSGAAAGEVAVIVDYVDLTGTITLDEAMANTPGNTDTFEILSTHVHPKSQIADVVLDELLAGHTDAGSLGKAVADILEDTGELQTDLANGGRLDLLIDAILEDTGTTLPATLAALNDLSAADVNAQLVDVVGTDVIEGTLTQRDILRVLLAFVAGTTTGGNTTSVTFKSQDGNTNRIVMTVDSDGDRSAVTVDGA